MRLVLLWFFRLILAIWIKEKGDEKASDHVKLKQKKEEQKVYAFVKKTFVFC